MSYVIPTNELTLTDEKAFRGAAVEAGIARALDLGIASVREELTARAAFPRDDLGTAATGWANNRYITAAIAAINAWASAFSNGVLPASAHQLANTQVCVFYKFADTMANPVVTGLRFRQGRTGASTLAAFYLQLETEAKLEPDIYLSEPVIYNRSEWLFIEIYNVIAIAVGETIPFGTFIVEPVGGTIS